MNPDKRKERKIQTSQQYAMKTNSQIHPQYIIPITNRFQVLPSQDFPLLSYAQASTKPCLNYDIM